MCVLQFHEALSSFCCVSGRYIEGVGNGLGANHPYTIAHTHTLMHTHTLTIEIQLRTEELCLKTQGIAQTYRGALEAVGAGLPDQTRPRGGKLILV